jgi:glycosyltransferase involved in cell wall biosynthesis
MPNRKVLYVVHNHPTVRPGGAETYALELYEAMRDSGGYEPIFLAKGGPPISSMRRPHEGTLLGQAGSDPNQYFFFSDCGDYDWLNGTSPQKDQLVKFFHEFLRATEPDIVHFQHTLFFGYDILRQTRNTLPRTPIVYTLHEYLPICHRNGQMLRTNDEELCSEESPRRCHECFPNHSPQAFFMRKRFVQSHFALVDRFLAPSHFLLQRYADWGIPREKMEFEDYGRRSGPVAPERQTAGPRNRIAFFGQFTFFKGIQVLLKAMALLAKDCARSRISAAHSGAPDAEVHCWVHGANLELQPGTFQNEFRALIEQTRSNVTLAGRYHPDEIGRLMENVDWVVIPSIWWENAPLVIQEAFAHGRPVICSDIGGMAEKVTHERDGLHFRANDPVDLTETIRRAVNTPGLWEKLRAGITPVYRVEDSVAKLTGLYDRLIEASTANDI